MSAAMARSTTTAPSDFRIQGFDPLLLISQIIAITSLHYLTLSFVSTLLLTIVCSKNVVWVWDLDSQGGQFAVGQVMDWRTMAGSLGDIGQVVYDSDGMMDRSLLLQGANVRSWVLCASWLIVSLIEVIYLYQIIRRPTYILDFSLTLLFNHLILTTYYAASFPTSLIVWIVFILSNIIQIVWAEQLCIKREMRSNLAVGNWKFDQRDENPSNGSTGNGHHRRATATSVGDVAMTLLSTSNNQQGYHKVSTAEQ